MSDSGEGKEERHWFPYSYRTDTNKDRIPSPYCLILLNQPVLDPALAVRLWKNSSLKVTVDGGTSVWAKLINNSQLSIGNEVPDLITGDFDSADKENIEYFKRMGAEVVETMDQDQTDFTKCLDEISKRLSRTNITTNENNARIKTANEDEPRIESANEKEVRIESANEKEADIEVVYAYVENSGRLDQIMANIQTLYLGDEYLPRNPVYLINSQSISWLLQPGKHSIHLQDVLSTVGINTAQLLDSLHCGLIPLSGPTLVTTTGLKWNLTGDELKFGALISTSNAFASKDVMVETDKPLLWTMDIVK